MMLSVASVAIMGLALLLSHSNADDIGVGFTYAIYQMSSRYSNGTFKFSQAIVRKSALR
jgi:hypothetical protein